MKKLMFVPVALLLVTAVCAQDSTAERLSKKERKAEKREKTNTIIKLQEEEDFLYKKHSIFGIKLNTDGYGISWEKGIYKTPRRTTIYQVEINEKKHPKEEKISTSVDLFGQFNQAIYAKTNNFYQFKVGYGQQYRIGTKANKNGVGVYGIAAGGLSAGIMKPYFIDVYDENNQKEITVKYTDSLPPGNYPIVRASGFTKGWDEVKFSPGMHAKTALRFDYGKFNEAVGAIEVGINAEYYFTKISQIVENTDKHFFFNAYVSVLFGKRK